MISKRILAIAGLITLAVSGLAVATPDGGHAKTLALVLRGPAVADARTVDIAAGSFTGSAFDNPLFDARTGDVVGRGTDLIMSMDPDGAGFDAQTLTIYRLKDGDIYTQNRVAVQPTSVPLFNSSHIVGALDAPGTNQIIGGTGAYRGATGRVRLSGMIDLSQLNATGDAHFNCIFQIELD